MSVALLTIQPSLHVSGWVGQQNGRLFKSLVCRYLSQPLAVKVILTQRAW